MRLFSVLILLSLCLGCAKQNTMDVSSLAKSDIDEVIEIHQQAVMQDLRSLMIKLYKRNPTMRHDRSLRTIEESVELSFSRPYNTIYKEWRDFSEPNDIIQMAVDERFKGDRVRAFILGLRKMLMASYNFQTKFYFTDSLDEQKLYNSARNLEIAAWVMAERISTEGKPILLSDAITEDVRNLSFQRLFGRMAATQDNLAQIISMKTGRVIKTVVIRAASLVFLPI